MSSSPPQSPAPKFDPVESARAYGIDLSLLQSNLLRAPEDRVRLACENADLVRAIRNQEDRLSLLSILERLREAGIRFVVVGGLAAAANGSARVPIRMEICCDHQPDNLAQLSAAMMSWDRSGDVDVCDRIEGIGGYDACAAASAELMGFRVLGIDAVIAATKVAQPLDIEHVRELEALQVLLGQ